MHQRCKNPAAYAVHYHNRLDFQCTDNQLTTHKSTYISLQNKQTLERLYEHYCFIKSKGKAEG